MISIVKDIAIDCKIKCKGKYIKKMIKHYENLRNYDIVFMY